MTLPLLFKFTLAALLLIWPAAVESKFYPGPKVDKPAYPITQDTPDEHVMAYCLSPTERRVCRIAREVATVVHEHAELDRIPFSGPAAQQATVLALLEIAWHESGFRSKVEDCTITGDLPAKWSKPNEGRAVSLFQLQSNNWYDLFEMTKTKPPRHRWHKRDAICKSNPLATRLALGALMRQAMTARGTTKPAGVQGMFYTYASGKGGKTKAGQEHVLQFEAMMRQNGIVLKGMWAEVKR
jgi:hypothetical protein